MRITFSNDLFDLIDAVNDKCPRVIDELRAKKMANDLNRCTYFETCATYGLNVDAVFQHGTYKRNSSIKYFQQISNYNYTHHLCFVIFVNFQHAKKFHSIELSQRYNAVHQLAHDQPHHKERG